MGFTNYGAGYVSSNPLETQEYSAGATKLRLAVSCHEGLSFTSPFGMYAFRTSCAAGGAVLQRSGGKVTVKVKKSGAERIICLFKAHGFRQVAGNNPKVWHTSESRCEGGLLLVAAPGFVFEAHNFRRPWRRFVVTAVGMEEIAMSEEVI